MHTETIDYTDGDITCEGFAAYDASDTSRRPCVILSHAWHGQTEIERAKAVELARLGYVGFALDMYGKGVRGNPVGDNSNLMSPFMEDRALLRRRIQAAVEAARRHPMVDPDRIGAVGYCFGGMCALDLARSSAPGVRGVVSFHGLLIPPNLGEQPKITMKILILHGYSDPMAPPDHVLGIARELTEAQADWQIHAYGHAMHAFTFVGANMPERGIVHNAAAERRSWIAMKSFFEEVFS